MNTFYNKIGLIFIIFLFSCTTEELVKPYDKSSPNPTPGSTGTPLPTFSSSNPSASVTPGENNNNFDDEDSYLIIETIAGNGSPGFSGDGGPAVNAKLNSPAGIVVDKDENIIFADSGNLRIRKIDKNENISTIAGSPKCHGIGSGDGGKAVDSCFDSPISIALDNEDNLLIADAMSGKIRKINNKTGFISTIAGGGTGGSWYEGPSTGVTFYEPLGITADDAGNIYVANSGRHIINKISCGNILRFAGLGGHKFMGEYKGFGSPATEASLNMPTGMTVSNAGELYFADTKNNVIRKIDKKGIITTFAGNVHSGFSGDNGTATSARFYFPRGVAIDKNGNVFITDWGNSVVWFVSPKGIINRVAGNGKPGYAGDGNVSTVAILNKPLGIAINNNKTYIYITDSMNNCIRRLRFKS